MNSTTPGSEIEPLVERVAREIERYGEGLVPELRIVCTWLANHFRDEEDARAAIAAFEATRTPEAAQVEMLRRVTDVAENLAGELRDPGTEALAAIHCARAALAQVRP